MRLKNTLLITLFGVLLTFCAIAQKRGVTVRTKSSYTRDRHNFRAPVVGHHKAKTICPIFENSKYPYQGVGFKMGDPFAFTYKFYPSKKMAFVADIGLPSSGLYSKQFRSEFDQRKEELMVGTSEPSYSSHRVRGDVVAEIKWLFQTDVNKLAKGLQLYTGLGLEYRATKLEYDYFQNIAGTDEFGRISYKRTTTGIDVIGGIEYAYFQLPISAFMEMEYNIDLVQAPGISHFKGGIGLRYVF